MNGGGKKRKNHPLTTAPRSHWELIQLVFFVFFPLEYNMYPFSFKKNSSVSQTCMHTLFFFFFNKNTRTNLFLNLWMNFKISQKVKHPGCWMKFYWQDKITNHLAPRRPLLRNRDSLKRGESGTLRTKRRPKERVLSEERLKCQSSSCPIRFLRMKEKNNTKNKTKVPEIKKSECFFFFSFLRSRGNKTREDKKQWRCFLNPVRRGSRDQLWMTGVILSWAGGAAAFMSRGEKSCKNASPFKGGQ